MKKQHGLLCRETLRSRPFYIKGRPPELMRDPTLLS